MKKNAPTRSRTQANRERLALADRLRAARESAAAARNIRKAAKRPKPARPTAAPNRAARRGRQLAEASAARSAYRATRTPGEQPVPAFRKGPITPSRNTPHRNPNRHLKPGFRARKDLS